MKQKIKENLFGGVLDVLLLKDDKNVTCLEGEGRVGETDI